LTAKTIVCPYSSFLARYVAENGVSGSYSQLQDSEKILQIKEKVNNDPSEWVIFENTHEAIIDQETFEIVQHIRDGRRRLTPMGEMPVLSGMLFCAYCGAKLYQVRARGWNHEQEHFVCATYRKQKGKCSSHQIHNVQVEQILLTEINRMLAFVRDHENEFVEMLTKKNEKDLNRQLRDSNRELEQAMQRIHKLDEIIQRLYEDNIDGKVSDERFARMTATYEQEQKTLEAISKAKVQRLNIDSFRAQVKKYTEVKKLDAAIIHTLVERIDVFKPEKVPGTRTKKQTILIHWNFIGAVDLPDTQKKSA
jgi:site-specific DNA recombinase